MSQTEFIYCIFCCKNEFISTFTWKVYWREQVQKQKKDVAQLQNIVAPFFFQLKFFLILPETLEADVRWHLVCVFPAFSPGVK